MGKSLLGFELGGRGVIRTSKRRTICGREKKKRNSRMTVVNPIFAKMFFMSDPLSYAPSSDLTIFTNKKSSTPSRRIVKSVWLKNIHLPPPLASNLGGSYWLITLDSDYFCASKRWLLEKKSTKGITPLILVKLLVFSTK